MDLSTSMRFVMVRAQAEASRCGTHIFPEHLLLAILKIAELSAGEIAPTSRHKKETDRDIAALRKKFQALQVDSGAARGMLRRMLRYDPPVGNGQVLTAELLERAAERAKHDMLYPSDVLLVMTAVPTPAMQAVFNLQARAADNPLAETGLCFLSSLTRRIRDMRYMRIK